MMLPKELQHMKPLQPGERLGQNRDSEYLGAEDIDPGTEPVLTIAALFSGLVTLQRGKEQKDVIAFQEDSVPGLRNVRPLIVNATNRKTLRKLFGNVSVETLVGQRIQLYVDHNVRDPSSGERIDGIRVRPRKPAEPRQILCSDCGKPIQPSGQFTVEIIAARSTAQYGVPVCVKCGKIRRENAQKTESNPADNGAEIADNKSNKPNNEEE